MEDIEAVNHQFLKIQMKLRLPQVKNSVVKANSRAIKKPSLTRRYHPYVKLFERPENKN